MPGGFLANRTTIGGNATGAAKGPAWFELLVPLTTPDTFRPEDTGQVTAALLVSGSILAAGVTRLLAEGEVFVEAAAGLRVAVVRAAFKPFQATLPDGLAALDRLTDLGGPAVVEVALARAANAVVATNAVVRNEALIHYVGAVTIDTILAAAFRVVAALLIH